MIAFNDTAFPKQWQLGAAHGINILDVYADYSGAGIRIGVVDTGLDLSNPDFAGRVDLAGSWDALEHDADPNNLTSDQHGTEVGLIIGAAANNGFGRVGAAWGSTLVAFRFDSRGTRTVEQEAELLKLQTSVDVSNNSWSRSGEFFRDDFGKALYAESAAATAAAATLGRDGLGTVLVRSAGNDNLKGDDVNTHNYYNNRYSIVVASSDENGTIRPSANPGAAILVTAPGGVTSWAAPMVSSTAALMLEANPELGYRDVQKILALTARITDAEGAGWFENAAGDWNGGGMHVSRRSGYGLIDAKAAVRLAESWEAQSTEANHVQATVKSKTAFDIPDQGSNQQSLRVDSSLALERVEVALNLAHNKLGDLKIVLVSPSGTESVLLDQLGNGLYVHAGGKLNFTLTSAQFLGEDPRGDWTLRVEDKGALVSGTVKSWALTLHGGAASSDTMHVFTEEFAALAAQDGGRALLSDAEGRDTLNAAAVDADSIIDLAADGVSRIAGQELRLAEGTVIEDAVTGEGNDLLMGNAADNRLRGGRGDDQLLGREGDDQLEGGTGHDLLDGGAGADLMIGGAGDDRYMVDNIRDRVVEGANGGTDTVFASVSFSLAGQFTETLILTGEEDLAGIGNSLANRITGNAGDNLLLGQGGNDLLEGGAGNDRLEGGEGADRLDGGEGADLMIGGAGSDTYLVDNAGDRITDSAGIDTVISSISYSLGGQFLERLTLTGEEALNATGNSLANTLIGNAGDNSLLGLAGTDRLEGGGGNDLLDGGAGADVMIGGQGDDLFIVDNIRDRAMEKSGEGTDTVLASVSFSLGGQFTDNLTLTGQRDIDGTGNSLDNLLTGNAGDNNLQGKAGNDILVGGMGHDTLDGGAGADIVRFNAPEEGGDTILGHRSGEDRIQISASGFGGGLQEGMDLLASGVYVQSADGRAATAEARLIYDTTEQKLLFDADGSGGEEAVVLAHLPGQTSLPASDIQIIG